MYQWQSIRDISLIAHFILRKATQGGNASMRLNRR
jgi:hypothetical protein